VKTYLQDGGRPKIKAGMLLPGELGEILPETSMDI